MGIRKRLGNLLRVVGLAVCTVACGSAAAVEPAGDRMKQIVYIEASTGRAWNLDQFPKRTGLSHVAIQFIPVYDFDKAAAVAKALGASAPNKPSVVVIQECSAYFPGPLDEYKKMYRGWIQQIKSGGVTPVIATTVPPAAPNGFWQQTKESIKIHILGRQSQYEQIAQFNDWLRQEARQEGVMILDLEVALRRSATDRSMNDSYDAGDGTHLNGKAYQLLDGLFAQLVKDIR